MFSFFPFCVALQEKINEIFLESHLVSVFLQAGIILGN